MYLLSTALIPEETIIAQTVGATGHVTTSAILSCTTCTQPTTNKANKAYDAQVRAEFPLAVLWWAACV